MRVGQGVNFVSRPGVFEGDDQPDARAPWAPPARPDPESAANASVGRAAATPAFGPACVPWQDGARVVSSAEKFVVAIPPFDAPPQVYPQGHSRAGEQIIAWGRTDAIGFAFENPTDAGDVYADRPFQNLRAVDGFLIFNHVTLEQAAVLRDLITRDPEVLTPAGFDRLFLAARQAGVNDYYDSDLDFVTGSLTPSPRDLEAAPVASALGIYRRDARDVCEVFRVGKSCVFNDKHVFGDEGGVVLRQSTGRGYDYRGIQPEIFARDYRLESGAEIDLEQLPLMYAPRAARVGWPAHK